MTRFLTPQEVLFIHSRLVDMTGGSHGSRDIGMLASAVARPRATFEGQELYPDIFEKAAALMHSLILNRPFVDGNKRTGIAAVGLFLQQNGWQLLAGNEALELFTLRVASAAPPHHEIAAWLQKHSAPLK